jgi:transposase
MSIVTERQVFVGLDYHQEWVQVCILDATGKSLWNARCRNDAGQIAAAVRRQGGPVLAGIEACCGAANLAKELTERAGWRIGLAHAGFVARMKQNPDKTDYGDARLLADLVRVGYLPQVWLAPDRIVELRRLVRFRQQLVDQRRDVKLRLRALLRDERITLCRQTYGSAWSKRWLARLAQLALGKPATRWIVEQLLGQLTDLSRRLVQVEQRLAAEVAEDAVVAKLRTFAGIGPITAATMRAEIAQFERFHSGKQLARFCGLSPQNASSGQRQADAGLVRAGNRQLRAVLIEAAHRLLRGDPQWGQFGARLLRRGKPRALIVAAVANRWVRWLYHQMQPARLTTSGQLN